MLLITGGHVSNGGAGEGVQRSFLRRSRKLQVRTIVPLGPKRSPRGKNTEGGIFRAGRNLESRRYFQVNGVFLVGGGGRGRGEVGRQGGRGRMGREGGSVFLFRVWVIVYTCIWRTARDSAAAAATAAFLSSFLGRFRAISFFAHKFHTHLPRTLKS